MPRHKLPQGWTKTTLAEICLPVATIQPGRERDAEFTYFDIGGIDNQQNRIAETKTVLGRSAPSRARQAVQKGDILFSTVRTYLRNIARIENEPPNPVASTGFTVIRVGPGVAGGLVFQQVLSEQFLQPLHALQTGSSYPAVRDRDVFAQPVMLPPAAEQERIVAKLDAILSRISAGEAAAQRALTRLKRYRAAVLHAAVTGELTREWRKTQPKPDETGAGFLRRLLATRRARWEEAELARLTKSGKPPKDGKWKVRYPEPTEADITDLSAIPRGWAWASLDQVLESLRNGVSESPRESGGLPILRISAVRPMRVDVSDRRYLPAQRAARYADYVLDAGDLLFTRYNGSQDLVGVCGRVSAVTEPLVHPDKLIRGKPVVGADHLGEFIELSSNCGASRDFIKANMRTTAGQWGISGGSLKQMPLPLPPPDEVCEIVRQVEHRLTLADRLAASLETALARARAWRQSVLNTAFAGHLVPQNADDEPASVLLEKIRAARELLAAQPKPKRGRDGRKKSMKGERRKLLEVLKEAKAPMKPEELFAAAGFDESTVEAFFSELKELTAKKKVREKRDPQDRGFVRLEVRA